MDEISPMNRPCPFCASAETHPWQSRPEGAFLRCESCGSYLKGLDLEAFHQLHATAFEDGSFLERITSTSGGTGPDRKTWSRFFGHLEPGTMLEIGPGTGRLLAAAKDGEWRVLGIETSPTHRAWIREAWGLETLASLDDLPAEYQADLIVMINVLEHVFDPQPLLAHLSGLLKPGGRLFISLPNASCTVPSLLGVWWSMFKQPDHVSIPTRKGIEALAERSGWKVEQVWSTEMAFETILGLAIALRDRTRASERTRVPESESPLPPPAPTPSSSAQGSLLRGLSKVPPALDPLAQVSGWCFRAGTLKAWLVRP